MRATGSGVEERQLLENFECDRCDNEYCLDSTVRSFLEDLKVLQYCIDKDIAKNLEPKQGPMPHRKETVAQASAREQIQEMSRDDLQALLAQRLSRNRKYSG